MSVMLSMHTCAPQNSGRHHLPLFSEQENWPRYNLTAEREEELNKTLVALNWRDRYLYYEFETRRPCPTEEDLDTLRFHFNFTPLAGGQGIRSLRPACFSHGRLLVPGYPPLPYRLIDPPPHPPTPSTPAASTSLHLGVQY